MNTFTPTIYENHFVRNNVLMGSILGVTFHIVI